MSKIHKYCLAVYEDGETYVGTDAYFPCDGRWSISTIIEKAKEHYNNYIRRDYYGFRVYFGTILNGNPKTKIIKL